MSLFRRENAHRLLGIDIGASAIKLVEIENDRGRGKLYTYAFAEQPASSMNHNFLDDAEGTGKLLKSMLVKAKADATRAASAVPMSDVFSAVITVQAAADGDIKEAVELQVRKLITIPIEQMYLDTKVLEKKDRFTTVLVTGAEQKLVNKIMAIFKLSGLSLAALEPESFALIRSLIGKDPASIVLVDVGYVRTNIMVVERGIPYLSRSIVVGGKTLTDEIAATAGVSAADAEKMKRDAPATAIIGRVLGTLTNEIKYLMESRSSQTRGERRVEKIILTGGSARLDGFAAAVEKSLAIKTYLGDPWARVVYPLELKSALEDLGPRFSVAVGLAMRDIQ